jgi:hypothetical protein
MQGSLPTRLESLDLAQTEKLAQHRKRWAEVRLSTAPCDRAAAEEGVALAYRAVGLPPPQRMVWCGGPVEIARLWAQAQRDEIRGGNLKAEMIDKLRRLGSSMLADRLSPRVINRVFTAARISGPDTVAGGVRDAVQRGTSQIRPRKWTLARRLLFQPYRFGRVINSMLAFEHAGCSNHDLEWTGTFIFLRDACDLGEECEPLRGLMTVAMNVGWIVPHEEVCWLSERHNLLRYDDGGRLHCDHGPALKYPDGWSAYAWRGVIVPRSLIEHPERITVEAIDGELDVHIRRCMIEIYKPQRFIADGGAMRVSSDDKGVLWQKRWSNGDTWAAVEVVNGTPEPDGSYKHYVLQVPPMCRTASEAVAWTYGLTERQYRRLAIRT